MKERSNGAPHGGTPEKGEMAMKRFMMLCSSFILSVALAGVVSAQSSDQGAGAATNGQGSVQTSPAPSVPPVPAPAAEASTSPSANAKPNPALDAARQKAMKASGKELDDVAKKVQELENGVETEATTKGDATVAGRIAGEFGMTADALTAERSQFGRGWGELMIAHTLAANSKTNLTVADLFQMRTEGMGWGQIAHGMDLKMGDLVAAVKAESRVATGLAKPDGKPAVIHSMHAGAGAGVQAGTKVPHGKGGVSASVGAGVSGSATKDKAGK